MQNIIIVGHSFYDLLFYFTLYSLLGWCIEVIYAFYNSHKFVNRGFLYGPFCPLYGFGAIIFVIFSKPVNANIIELFIVCTVIATILEYITGYILEKVFHTKWWDYSKDPLNYKGRVCLLFSVIWGMSGVILLKLVHPLGVNKIKELFPKAIGYKLMYAALLYFIVDFTFTLVSLVQLNKLFKQLEDIKCKIIELQSELKLKASNKELLNNISHDLKEKYENAVKNIERKYSRLFSAFPHLGSDKLKRAFNEISSRIKLKHDAFENKKGDIIK